MPDHRQIGEDAVDVGLAAVLLFGRLVHARQHGSVLP
ncbi:hypothetical protein Rrhod_3029 [Rhodococcus rhodnii LMG 5362]|uniref:Uncharacterized protein n=1 Tax=Rhodococcus rhodnii LMG 5362 TaxID=1273125 RepID=R7WNH4_9NOCA|nr:hypothetical protein Rrhod_3029 [Rhodococcus rhodnii LMG 5362]